MPLRRQHVCFSSACFGQVASVANDFGGDARHDGPVGHIMGHDRAHAHYGMIANAHAIGDAGVGADPHISANNNAARISTTTGTDNLNGTFSFSGSSSNCRTS